jgi:hypothetical protein
MKRRLIAKFDSTRVTEEIILFLILYIFIDNEFELMKFGMPMNLEIEAGIEYFLWIFA